MFVGFMRAYACHSFMLCWCQSFFSFLLLQCDEDEMVALRTFDRNWFGFLDSEWTKFHDADCLSTSVHAATTSTVFWDRCLVSSEAHTQATIQTKCSISIMVCHSWILKASSLVECWCLMFLNPQSDRAMKRELGITTMSSAEPLNHT